MKAIILLVMAGLFIVLSFLFRKHLKALYFKLLYGEFHINYLHLFYEEDSYYNSYYPSKSTLYNQIDNIKIALQSSDKYQSDLPLFFQNIEYGINTKKLISLIGKPVSHDIISLGDEKVVSLEYNLDQYNIVDKYVYYFKNDHYYMGEFHFNKVKEETTNEILDSINAKFRTSFDGKEGFVIQNINGNHLIYKDLGYRITISYFSENCEEINHLINYQQAYQIAKRKEYSYQPNIQKLSF